MKATKKIVGATAALVAAVALSAGSTFAWFTTQNTAKVNNISATVVTNSNLQVALGEVGTDTAPASGWGSVIDMTGKFSTVKLDALTLSEDGANLVDRETTEAAGTEYVSFRIWFRSTEDASLQFDATASSVTSTASDTVEDVYAVNELTGFGREEYASVAEGAQIKASAANATRVSFKGATGNTMVWEPNSEAGFCLDVDERCLASKYEDDLAKSVDPDASTVAYKNKKYTTQGSITAVVDNTVLLSLTANTAAYLDIWIWIEGNDGDCLNSIFDDTLNSILGFESVSAT